MVIHGTDTMAFAASVLSFVLENLEKPVILTGAQVTWGQPCRGPVQLNPAGPGHSLAAAHRARMLSWLRLGHPSATPWPAEHSGRLLEWARGLHPCRAPWALEREPPFRAGPEAGGRELGLQPMSLQQFGQSHGLPGCLLLLLPPPDRAIPGLGVGTGAWTLGSLMLGGGRLDRWVPPQVPIHALQSDGRENLLGALLMASQFVIPEVRTGRGKGALGGLHAAPRTAEEGHRRVWGLFSACGRAPVQLPHPRLDFPSSEPPPLPQVCLFFQNQLFRGNRTTKVDARRFAAFCSPNLLPLATVGADVTSELAAHAGGPVRG